MTDQTVMPTQIIKVTAWADLDADPVNCPRGHTSIERGAKSTGSGYWCSECRLRYVYEIIERDECKPLSMSDQLALISAENDALVDENKRLTRLVCELLNARENVDDNKDRRVSELPLTENDKATLRRILAASEVKTGCDACGHVFPDGKQVHFENCAGYYEDTSNEYSHEDARDSENEEQLKLILMEHCTWCDADYDINKQSIHCPHDERPAGKNQMKVTLCTYVELPEWVNRNHVSDNGSGKEYANYLLIEDGDHRACYSDAMEPEDRSFLRNLKWIKTEIERAASVRDDRLKYRLSTDVDQTA